METQSYYLIKEMKKKAQVLLIAHDPTKESKLKFYLSLRHRVKHMLDKEEISLVHCNDGLMAILCAWIRQYKDVVLTASLHGLDVIFPNPIYQRLVTSRLSKYDRLYAVSEATADECRQRNIAPEKVLFIPNGVKHSAACEHERQVTKEGLCKKLNLNLSSKNIIVTVGRSVKRKGYSWFIENVLSELDDTILLIVGPFDDQASFSEKLIDILPKRIGNSINLLLGNPTDQVKLRKLKNDTDHGQRFHHCGRLSQGDMDEVLDSADLFVMPNIKVEGDFEGFGLVTLEANLRGLYVAAANLQGISDAIHHRKNGHLLPVSDAITWRKAIKSLLSKNSDLAKMGKNARNYAVDNFSWTKMAQAYYEDFIHLYSATKKNPLDNQPITFSKEYST